MVTASTSFFMGSPSCSNLLNVQRSCSIRPGPKPERQAEAIVEDADGCRGKEYAVYNSFPPVEPPAAIHAPYHHHYTSHYGSCIERAYQQTERHYRAQDPQQPAPPRFPRSFTLVYKTPRRNEHAQRH